MTAIDSPRLEDLYQKALQIEKHLADKRLASLKVREEEKRQLGTLRESRRADSLKHARSIFEWVRHFTQDAKGSKILSILQEVTLFQGQYWNYKPKDDKDYQALLIVDSQGILRYRESCHGMLNSNGMILVKAEDMVGVLHPDYIRSAAQAILSGQIYDNLEHSMIQRLAQLVQRRGIRETE